MSDANDPSGSRPTRRRPFLKTIGAGIGSATIAGCTGDGGGGDGGSGGGDGGGATTGTASSDLSGVTIKYWNITHAQSRAARDYFESLVSRFEKDTGVKVEPFWSPLLTEGGAQSKWRQAFQSEDYPVLFNAQITQNLGQFVAGDWIEPVPNYIDQFDDATQKSLQWAEPIESSKLKVFEEKLGNSWYTIPFGFFINVPFIGNVDHFEQAGLDPEKDFPPKNYEHLVEVSKTLKQEGPTEYPYLIFGANGDLGDCMLPQWALAEGGADGTFITPDWQESNWKKDVWVDKIKKYVAIHREHNLSGPNTVTATDEDAVPLLSSQKRTFTQPAHPNHPDFYSQVPNRMDNNKLMWAPSWGGKGGPGAVRMSSHAITKKPSDVSASKWNKKQKAAIEFLKLWQSKEEQKKMISKVGLMPTRDDVWDAVKQTDDPGNLKSTVFNMAEDAKFGWSAHPNYSAIQLGKPADFVTQALRGEISPEKAAQKGHNFIQGILDEDQF